MHYASRKTHKRGNREFVLVACAVCGKTRYRRKYYAEKFKLHFCSPSCVSEARRQGIHGKPLATQLVQCSVCGITIKRKPSELSKSGKQFCSHKCLSLGIKKRLVPTNPIKTNNASAARGRARYKFPADAPCEVCGKTPSQRHHKDGNPSNNSASNIARLCAKHHVHADRMGHMSRISKIGVPLSLAQSQRDPNGKFISGARAKCTVAQFKKIKKAHGNKCAICGRGDKPLERDHIVPLADGGSLHADNIQPLCRSCNASKGRKRARQTGRECVVVEITTLADQTISEAWEV